METFSYEARVIVGTGKQDKIELELGDWRAVGGEHAVTYFLNLLGNEPFTSTASEMEGGGPPPYSSLFCHHSGTLRPVTEMRIRTGGRGGIRRVGAPLYSGLLLAIRERSGTTHEHVRRLSLRLSINPTRYVAHQAVPQYQLYGQPDAWGAPRLVARSRHLRTPRETSLDANDNILLSRRIQAFARPENWLTHVRRYWEAVIGQLNAEFLRVAEAADVGLACEPFLNLGSVETYWEFASEDPTALVLEMTPALTALGIDASVRAFPYPDGLAESEFTGNSRSVKILLNTGVTLSVYAKTTGRVRFEIRHNLRECAAALGGRHTSGARRGHPEGGYSILYEWLGRLEVDAVARLNRVLAVLEQQQFRPASALRPYNLMHRIIQACPDESTAENVLSLLVNNGAMRIRSNDPFRSVVEALVRVQVLERLGGTRNPTRYVVTPQFRFAVAELRGGRRRTVRVRSAI